MLKVIGAGFGRTGTNSLKEALEQLGFGKCHHMVEVLPSEIQVRLWHEVAEKRSLQWDAIFDGFQSSCDFPSSAYYKELAAHYPDAKVVLTVRSPESWYDSAAQTIYEITYAIPGWLIRLVPHVRRLREMIETIIWQGVFDGKFEDRDYAISVFEQHIENVKAIIPADRLLVMHIKEGWEPLCHFLNVPVPDTPFPRVNDTAEFRKRIQVIRLFGFLPWVLGGVIALAGMGVAFASGWLG